MKNPYEDLRVEHFASKEQAIDALLNDMQKFKVHLPENFSKESLYSGYGESVCFIINDLTNRELIRRKFTFEQPDPRRLLQAGN
jgi:hypothetical protein